MAAHGPQKFVTKQSLHVDPLNNIIKFKNLCLILIEANESQVYMQADVSDGLIPNSLMPRLGKTIP
jgi:hypothetical protein